MHLISDSSQVIVRIFVQIYFKACFNTLTTVTEEAHVKYSGGCNNSKQAG